MSIKKVSVDTPNGERTIVASRPKAVRAVITVRQQFMKHVTMILSFAKTLANKVSSRLATRSAKGQ